MFKTTILAVSLMLSIPAYATNNFNWWVTLSLPTPTQNLSPSAFRAYMSYAEGKQIGFNRAFADMKSAYYANQACLNDPTNMKNATEIGNKIMRLAQQSQAQCGSLTDPIAAKACYSQFNQRIESLQSDMSPMCATQHHALQFYTKSFKSVAALAWTEWQSGVPAN